MAKFEIDQIKSLIADVHEALGPGGNPKTLPLHHTELRRIIKTLMDETGRRRRPEYESCVGYA